MATWFGLGLPKVIEENRFEMYITFSNWENSSQFNRYPFVEQIMQKEICLHDFCKTYKPNILIMFTENPSAYSGNFV
jgi:hypothetical protein